MRAYGYRRESGRIRWTEDRSRADEWEAEGKKLFTRRVWINSRNQPWFKPGEEWKPLRKEKVK
jgi:hypothetical protein